MHNSNVLQICALDEVCVWFWLGVVKRMLGADDELIPKFPVFPACECDAEGLDFYAHVDVEISVVYVLHAVLITV